jgi:PTS system mannose-specific IIB component/fructoselysine and glucoselysine-specific PTS system IIB component
VSLEGHRIDDRFVHGQVVVGWGQALDLRLLIVVDDELAESPWEQDLYRMAAPPAVDLVFSTVADAASAHAGWTADLRPSLLLTGDIPTMRRLVEAVPAIRRVTIGGLHAGSGRTERRRYVFLNAEDEGQLRSIASHGVEVAAQDLPATRPVALEELLHAGHPA